MEASMAGRIAAPLDNGTPAGPDGPEPGAFNAAKAGGAARIILLAADGVSVSETARRLCIWRKTASMWRKRWREADAAASTAERLSDAPRCGAPGKFTPEQVCAIIALACEEPKDSDLPISQWSQSEVARQAVKRGIVASISHGSVGRFFKRVGA